MARPVVSDAAERIYSRAPAYQKDEGDASGWVMLHLCEAAARTVARCTEALRHDDRGSGWRRMRDPNRCPSWALDWLRHHVGLDAFPADYTEQQKRDLIRNSPRFRRGTEPAILAAAKLHLTGEKRVYLFKRVGGSRHYRTAVFADDAPDPQRVYEELKLQKPATFIWDHDVLGGDTWADVEATHADWAEVEGDFTGWHHVLADPTHT